MNKALYDVNMLEHDCLKIERQQEGQMIGYQLPKLYEVNKKDFKPSSVANGGMFGPPFLVVISQINLSNTNTTRPFMTIDSTL